MSWLCYYTALILAGLKSCTCLGHVCTHSTQQSNGGTTLSISRLKCDIVRHFFFFVFPLRVLLIFNFVSKKSFLAGGDPALVDGNNKLRGRKLFRGKVVDDDATEQQCGHYYGISLNVRQTVKKCFFFREGGSCCVLMHPPDLE